MIKTFIGAHLSIQGGYYKACLKAGKLNCSAVQIFTKNQLTWRAPVLDERDAMRFKKERIRNNIKFAVGHCSYILNLASSNPALYNKSVAGFSEELGRSNMLGLDYLVLHPGSYKGGTKNDAIERMARAINQALKNESRTMVLIETTAGQGQISGWRFEELSELLKNIDPVEKAGVCLDTCHIFAAGYDIRKRDCYEKTIDIFDKIVGLKKIKTIHLNDSKRDLGSRVDRHAHIGKGKIGLEAFRLIINDPRFAQVPMIIETPKEGDMDRVNLELLKSLSSWP